eukprot:sb/3468156/
MMRIFADHVMVYSLYSLPSCQACRYSPTEDGGEYIVMSPCLSTTYETPVEFETTLDRNTNGYIQMTSPKATRDKTPPTVGLYANTEPVQGVEYANQPTTPGIYANEPPTTLHLGSTPGGLYANTGPVSPPLYTNTGPSSPPLYANNTAKKEEEEEEDIYDNNDIQDVPPVRLRNQSAPGRISKPKRENKPRGRSNSGKPRSRPNVTVSLGRDKPQKRVIFQDEVPVKPAEEEEEAIYDTLPEDHTVKPAKRSKSWSPRGIKWSMGRSQGH